MVSVLLSASVERCFVSRTQNFFFSFKKIIKIKSHLNTFFNLLYCIPNCSDQGNLLIIINARTGNYVVGFLKSVYPIFFKYHFNLKRYFSGFLQFSVVTVLTVVTKIFRHFFFLLLFSIFSKHQPSGPMLSISQNVRLRVRVSVCPSVCVCVHF